jgi:hypothetical protein
LHGHGGGTDLDRVVGTEESKMAGAFYIKARRNLSLKKNEAKAGYRSQYYWIE